MVGVYNKPNRGVRPYLRTDTESDEPLKKPKTIVNPEVCLKCPYKECKHGWCERVTKCERR